MRWLVLAVPLRILLIALGIYVLASSSDEPDWMTRSEEFAIQWRVKLSVFPTPESAAASYREVVIGRFESGEWAFGVCRDGRGFQDGGAIVVKDSAGRVRVFLSPLGIPTMLADTLRDAKSLDAFYKLENWNILQYEEVHLP